MFSLIFGYSSTFSFQKSFTLCPHGLKENFLKYVFNYLNIHCLNSENVLHTRPSSNNWILFLFQNYNCTIWLLEMPIKICNCLIEIDIETYGWLLSLQKSIALFFSLLKITQNVTLYININNILIDPEECNTFFNPFFIFVFSNPNPFLRVGFKKTRTTNVVRNARCARSRYTLKIFLKSINDSINESINESTEYI